jgi:SAM-dependent methyltransferase
MHPTPAPPDPSDPDGTRSHRPVRPPRSTGSGPGERPPAVGHGPVPPLVLTGERTLPGIADERYWFARHVVAYRHLAGLVGELAAATDPPVVVLDAGCGEGYGLAMLREAGADHVVGVDLDATTAAHARWRYAGSDRGVEVLRAELGDLPLSDGEMTCSVSLQVIEHLHDVGGALAELRRVTRRGGTVAIATPNRLTFTPDSEVPVNPFHTREFTAAELATELTAAGLAVERFLGVHHGARLAAAEATSGASLPEQLATGPPESWPRELRRLVHSVVTDDFELREGALDASVDLLAICRVPDR